MTIVRELAKNIRQTRFESFDEETVEHTKNRIIDVIGCAIGGMNAAGCRMIADLVKSWGGKEESSIFAHAGKAPAHNAAMVNSIMCRSFDFEPVEAYVHGTNFPSHISGTTVPTAMAVAEWKEVSGKELITALILGDDIASRILAASRFSLDSSWDGTGIVNTFGSTAIAGRMLKLSEAQLINAFGIALNQMAGSFQNIYDGSLCFKLLMGLSARAGIFAAELAGKGFTGPRDPLLSRHGYFSLYCQSPNPAVITQELGKKFFSDSTFKPYPACRSTHGAIECALELTRQHDIDAKNILEIRVGVTEITTRMFVNQPFKVRKFPQASATFNLPYIVASVLARKAIKLEHFTEESIRNPQIVSLAKKVKITAKLPSEKPLATEVAVIMKNGTKFATEVDIPRGDRNYNPITKSEIREKFRENVAFSGKVPAKKGEKLLKMVESLEKLDNVVEMIKELQI